MTIAKLTKSPSHKAGIFNYRIISDEGQTAYFTTSKFDIYAIVVTQKGYVQKIREGREITQYQKQVALYIAYLQPV